MAETIPARETPLAVVGASALFPGSADVGGFWRDILAGRDQISEVPPHYWLKEDYYDADFRAPDKTYAKRGAFLSPVEFQPLDFGIPPALMSSTDTCQLLALIVAQQVLEDATNGQFSETEKSRTSVILGVAAGLELLGEMASRLQRPVWIKALRESGIAESRVTEICDRIADQYVEWKESTFPGLLGNVVAGRIANRFDLGGTNCTTDAACASSFSSLSMAANELYLGHSDLVLTGGVDTTNDPFIYMCFSKTPALSPTGDCRPFADDADGTMLGEGLGMIALKRLADAERDGNRIYATIRGIGSSSDGRAKSVYAPRPEGQARALRRAYGAAGYGPQTVELVEAHGTGTKAGDVAEFAGLQQVFAEADLGDAESKQWCALGSVKSQIGHAKSAAAAAGIIKTVMALHHKVLPPTIKVGEPSKKLNIEASPFYLNTETRPWIRDGAHPRRASVSSFGFGGTNFHVTLEEYQSQGVRHTGRLRALEKELVLFSAENGAALVRDLAAAIKADPPQGALIHIARQSQEQFDPKQRCRLAVVAANEADLLAKLDQAQRSLAKDSETSFSLPKDLHYRVGSGAQANGEETEEAGKVAFLFSGQGSQYVGMGTDLAVAFDLARGVWDAEASNPAAEGRLSQKVFPLPVFSEADRQKQLADLTATQWAQPAVGAASLSMLKMLTALGVSPDAVGGHSFGEVTALHAAGVFGEEEFLSIARQRGALMAQAAAQVGEPGTMTAVVCSREEMTELLERWQTSVVIANHNSPRQVVLSGTVEGVSDIEKKLESEGIACQRLTVSTAFHSPLVSGSTEDFLDFLNTFSFKRTAIPVYCNATADVYPHEGARVGEAIRERLAKAVAEPVRFVDQIEAMYQSGVRTFLEVGPASILTRLVGRILKGRPHKAIALDKKRDAGVDPLGPFFNALGQLALSGLSLNWQSLWQEYQMPADPRKRDKPALAIDIDGSNYGKKYPPPGGAAALPRPNHSSTENDETNSVKKSDTPVLSTPTQSATPLQPAPPATEPQGIHPGANSAPSSVSSSGADGAWLVTYQEIQRQTAEAHAAFQTSMSQSHQAFLKAAEAASLGLAAMATGAPLPMVTQSQHAQPAVAQPVLQPVPVVAPAQTMVAPVPASPISYASPTVSVPSASPAPLATQLKVADLKSLLLDVVADKTGYPQEILQMEMSLEADLGIDSIKRVEILSAIQEQAPDLPEVDATEMAALQTLGQVLAYMQAHAAALVTTVGSNGSDIVSSGGNGAATEMNHASVSKIGREIDMAALLLDVVADKTGYPQDILKMEMSLEADLGIDSIKRVEILSAVQDRFPELPEVDATAMASLQTLGEVLAYMEQQSGASSSNAAGLTDARNDAPQIAPASAPSNGKTAKVERRRLHALPAAPSGQPLKGLHQCAKVVVTDEYPELAEALVVCLGQAGIPAEVGASVGKEVDGLIFLGGLCRGERVDAVAMSKAAFAFAKSLAPRLERTGGIFVTVQDTGGDFGLGLKLTERAWQAGLSGLVKTAALEWPTAGVRAIDLECGSRSPQVLAAALADELLRGGHDLEVGLNAEGGRIRLDLVADEGQWNLNGKHRIEEHAVFVVSGGARGVTAASLLPLARQCKARLLILGRTPIEEEGADTAALKDEAQLKKALIRQATAEGQAVKPADIGVQVNRIMAQREVRANLDALRRAGAEVLYAAVDVTDAEAVVQVVDGARARWGRIDGIIHGAGVLADKRIADKTPQQFARVFETKVLGLKSLLQATENDPLTTLCFFSSVAARLGNPGQCDYSMANEVLNKVALAEAGRRNGRCLVKSVNWGPWDGGMVNPALRAYFKKQGVALIPLEAGADMLLRELNDLPGSAVEVLFAGAGSMSLQPDQPATLKGAPVSGVDANAADHLARI